MNLILYDFEVQNLLKNGKGQIRRAIPIKFLPGYNPEWTGYRPIFEYGEFYLANSKGEPATKEIKCPFNVGEECWVRETWLKADDGYYYKANSSSVSEEARKDYGYKWRSPITMPRETSRLTIVPDRVWWESLQNISNSDIRAEGAAEFGCVTHRLNFQLLWDSHAKPGYKFADNPVVWCGEMKVKEY
jgi:hypothetical protein